MNKLADVISKLSTGEKVIDLQIVSSMEETTISVINKLMRLPTDELMNNLQQEIDPTEWYSPITQSQGLIPEN